jgi:hypothetical protein
MRRVRGLSDARDALAGGARQLVSEPFAACHAGVNYHHALLSQLQREFPGNDFTYTLCCGDDAAVAHDALRMGFLHVLCDCGEAQFDELAHIAQSMGAAVMRLDAAGKDAKPNETQN